MGKPTGFMDIEKFDRGYKPVSERISNYKEFVIPLTKEETINQAARCMDCGVPYCHNGCPVNNQIPDWNDLVYSDDWKNALENLHSTNNFPEFTGRICPAPCEAACTLNLYEEPVSIKSIECAIIDRGFDEGWIKPKIAKEKTGKKVSVIGAGPAGLACAQQLTRAGHEVTVYEKNNKAGGLLRYGIPDFKMEKHIIDRRINQLEDEGTVFKYGINVGVDVSIDELENEYDAIVLSGGSEHPRDLPVEGRDLDGIHFAMEFLPQQNKRVSNEGVPSKIKEILATNKNVIVIGGGDTGSDCIGTSIRQGAETVTQLEIMSIPPEQENKSLTWPNWPLKLRTSSSQSEGALRDFSVMTQSVSGENGKVTGINCVKVDEKMKPIPKTEFSLKADLILLAMGFVHPIHEGLIEHSKTELDERGNVKANTEDYKTSAGKIFTAGDMRRGQSLVVWAIREGRQCASSVDHFLTGQRNLPV
ncbi:MAG: glutamate synthase subunit beta [Rhizobiales bacterium TMED94]|nr:glutamate synthase [Rhodobiaceae bacterium]RPF88172.1 MAG: glutamate synthase subunit beta [Rhizobiales bacterium TMED94]|tara:strand:- start:449 stop:1870 length:1422 start_codon:yes stop_codon:yes gene_type:complete